MIDVSLMQRGRKHASRERGGVVVWVIASFLLISASLVIGGLFFLHNVRVQESRAGGDVRVETPFGSVHVQHRGGARPESMGVPLYPGAKEVGDGESASVDFSQLFGDNDLHIVAGKWRTSDPLEKVEKFYAAKFPEMSVVWHDGKVHMQSVNGHGKKVIVLHNRNGETEIALASVGEPKAN